jgi:hypothetical protein
MGYVSDKYHQKMDRIKGVFRKGGIDIYILIYLIAHAVAYKRHHFQEIR